MDNKTSSHMNNTTENTENGKNFIFDTSKKSYTIIDNWLFKINELSLIDKMIYIVLKSFAIQPNHIFPSHSTIAKSASCSRLSVIKSIKSLVAKQLLHVSSQQHLGRSNIYILNDPTQGILSNKITSLQLPHNNVLDDFTSRDRGVSDRDRGVSDRDRGVSDRDRGVSDRDRGVSDRDTNINTNTIIKIKNIELLTTTDKKELMFCFVCKNIFLISNLKKDKDNFNVCPDCSSNLVLPLNLIPLKIDVFKKFLTSYDHYKLFNIIDIINFQYSNKTSNIKNYKKLLLSLLNKDIDIPDGYTPYFDIQHQQNNVDDELKRIIKLQHIREEQDKKKLEKIKRDNLRRKIKEDKKNERLKLNYDKLSIGDKNKLIELAKKNIPKTLPRRNFFLEIEAFRIFKESQTERSMLAADP